MRRWLGAVVATVALILARLAVVFLPFRWLGSSVAILGHVPPSSLRASRRAVGVGHLITRTAIRLPWHSTCLVRALAARMILAALRIPSVLCLGVTKEDGGVRAHAWLMVDGDIVCGGREAPGYTPIAALGTRHTT